MNIFEQSRVLMQDKLMDDSAFVKKYKDTWVRTLSNPCANVPIKRWGYVKCHVDSMHLMMMLGFGFSNPTPSYKIHIRYYILPIKDNIIAHWRHLIQFASSLSAFETLDEKDLIISIDCSTETYNDGSWHDVSEAKCNGILSEYQRASIDKMFVPIFNEAFRDIMEVDIKSLWSIKEDLWSVHKDSVED